MSVLFRRQTISISVRSLPSPHRYRWSQIRNKSGPPKSPKIKGWSSLLKTNTLGKPASVLVLRDSETKRGGGAYAAQEPSLERKNVKNVDLEKLLASISKQQNEPGQEEASRSIDALRPRPSHENELVLLPAAQYEELSQALLQGFNSLQVSRYASLHEGKRIIENKKAGAKAQDIKSGTGTIRTDWNALDRDGTRKSVQRRKTITGKKALVDTILRSIWQVDVREEVEQDGVLSMQLEAPKFAMLTHGGQTSTLAELGRLHRIKVLVNKSKRNIGVQGEKYQCERLANAIENAVLHIHETSIGLELLEKQAKLNGKRVFSNADIEKLAQGIRCSVDFRDKGKKGKRLLVRALNEATANQFRRALVAAIGLPFETLPLLLNEDWEETTSDVWGLGMTEAGPGPKAIQSPSARFSFPNRIFSDQGTSQIRRSPGAVFAGKIGERALNHLTSPESRGKSEQQSQPGLSTTYSSDFGHVKLRTASDTLVKYPIPQLAHHANTDQPSSFTPYTIGTPFFFLQNLRETQPSEADLLKINLIPSPWHLPQGKKQQEVPPSHPQLELRFKVDRSSRSLRFQDLTTSEAPLRAHLMLFGSTLDVQMTRRDHRRVDNATQDPAIRDYVRKMEQSAVGFGTISPPPFLTLRNDDLLRTGMHDQRTLDPQTRSSQNEQQQQQQQQQEEEEEEEEEEVHYFTTNMHLVQELHFPFHTFNLIYSRIGRGDNPAPTRESLSLQMSENAADDNTLRDGGRGGDEDDNDDAQAQGRPLSQRRRDFLERTREIMAALNRGTGEMGMMDRRPDAFVGRKEEGAAAKVAL